METWDAHLLVRCADDLETIMKAASSDSSAEGRTVGTSRSRSSSPIDP